MTARRAADPGLRAAVRRFRLLARRLEGFDPEPAVPPPLPPGRTCVVPGRGEVFLRELDTSVPGGPPVLLVHGWTTSADLNWCWAYEPLGRRFGRVLAPDHRGHGRGIRTDEPFTLEAVADDLAALLRATGAAPAIVVGYSMGGPVSMLLWRRHPELVAGLVLQATALEWRASPRERVVWRLMGLFERLLRSTRSKSVVDRIVREVTERCPELVPHRGWILGEARRGDPEAIAAAGRALGRFDARPFASSIDVPTAVVVTTEDGLVRPSKQRALAEAVPGAEVLELASDHDGCLTAAGRFAGVTVAAVESVASRLR